MGPPGHITSPQEPYPSPDSPSSLASATTTHRQGNFLISTRKLPISKSGPIDEMSDSLGIPVPEMIFGDNLVAIQHGPSGFRIEFNAYDALDGVDKTGEKMLQVAYARDWSRSRERTSAGIKEVVKPYDWSYSTVYRGTVSTSPMEFQPTETPIPIELLKRRDPILFFDDVMLYESELDDNGISVFSVKVRVHEQRMLLLCRLFMRLDNVVVRVRDTRVYVDFGTDVVTREYTIKEAAFDDVKKALLRTGLVPDALTVALRDGNKIAEILPVVDGTLDRVSLAS
ncbi:type 2A phosphatase activator TIP41 [Xylariales sp. AK1849]|nr:type 2A phosphatase activator TIP41 [Xylariales sp. AK1849]